MNKTAWLDSWLQKISYWVTVLLPVILLLDKAPSDIAMSLVALLFVIHTIIAKDFKWLHKKWVKIAFIIWCYLLIRNLFTEDIETTFGRAASWIRFVLFAAACESWLFRLPKFFYRFGVSLAVSVGFLSVDLVFQYIIGYDLVGNKRVEAWHKGQWLGTRLTGPFSRVKGGIVLCWLAAPCYGLLLQYASKKWHYIVLMRCILLTGTAILLSGERMAMLLFLLTIALICLCIKAIRKLAIATALIMVLVVAGVFAVEPETFDRQVGSVLKTAKHFHNTPYGDIFNTTKQVIMQHPVFGIGLKQFEPFCQKMPRSYDKCHRHPHNIYTEWQVTSGIIGLVLFLVLLGMWIKHYWRVRHDVFITAMCMALIVRFWPIAITPSMFTAWAGVPLWMMIGMLLARITWLTKDKTG